MQYTIRNIPRRLDQALRRKARAEGKSLNQAAVDALERGLGLSGEPVIHHDLDHLFGTWVPDPAFDDVRADFEQIDPEIWK